MDQSARRTAYRLRFKEFGDLRVRARKPSFRGVKLLARVVTALGSDFRGEHVAAEVRLQAWGWLFDAFADALVGWDLTDAGVPVPPTKAGVYSQDSEFLLRVAGAWYHRVVLRSPEESAPDDTAAPADSGQSAARGNEPTAEEVALSEIPVQLGTGDVVGPGGMESEPVAVLA